jgi:hypothetical protein
MRTRSDGVPGVQLDVRLPWYRSLPLSCIERLDISINGDQVPVEDITLTLNGTRYMLDELPPLHEVVWFTLDAADVRVRQDRTMEVGEHDVEVTVQTRMPYVPAVMGWDFSPVAKYSKRIPLIEED